MLISYIGGPLHGRVDKREDLATEADVVSYVKQPGYSYKGSISADGEVIEASFVHTFVTPADYEAIELDWEARRKHS
ncbi:hypothetical protein [Lysobacter terrae]